MNVEDEGDVRTRSKVWPKTAILAFSFCCVLVSRYAAPYCTLIKYHVILYTGTPSGVGPVKPGQKIMAGITGLVEMSFNVEARAPSRF